MELTKKILNRWAEMTEWNHHTGVLMEIANHFGYMEIHEELRGIDEVHKKRGHILLNECLKRIELLHKLLEYIEKDYGKEVKEKVDSCL